MLDKPMPNNPHDDDGKQDADAFADAFGDMFDEAEDQDEAVTANDMDFETAMAGGLVPDDVLAQMLADEEEEEDDEDEFPQQSAEIMFGQYMEAGHDAAWNHDWTAAIEAYTRAVQLRPDEPDAHINLGLALLNNGQLPQALKVYKRAHQLAPDDPLPLERSADVLERMGQLREAAQQYIKVSDVYLAQRDLDKAIGNWERATQLTPGLVSVHARLAQAYERIGDKKQAVREYLTLAFNFQRLQDTEKAIRSTERALRLEKNNPQVLNTLRALKSGGQVVLPAEMTRRNAPQPTPTTAETPLEPMLNPLEALDEDAAAHPLGPMGEALELALVMLADHVMESGLAAYAMPTLQGMEQHRQGNHQEAIKAYEQAIKAGLKHPALQMSLGGLQVLTEQPQEALKHLSQALVVPQLKAGALHGMGQAYARLGEPMNAARNLIEGLRAVDTSLAISENELDDLQAFYDRLLADTQKAKVADLEIGNKRFMQLLRGTDWKQRIADTRRNLDEMLTLSQSSGPGGELISVFMQEGGERLPEAITTIENYIRQGLYTLAMDEAHYTIERSPQYLPVHVRMAEVMMKEGRIRQAINKYNTVARSYMVRGENDRAASILQMVLEMAPLDVDVRVSLIELLESEDRMLEALDQYIALANTYQQLGDFEMANQTYSACERLARRLEAPTSKLVEIKQHLADISQMRLNTRQAQRVYEEILELEPDNEKALRALIDVYYTQGNNVEAARRVDTLLGVYAKNGKVKEIASMLESLVRGNPSDTGLRTRLASFYRKTGQVQKAIEQLDALGELQLDAGLTRDAAATIRQIIALKPDRLDDYKRLLSQLSR